jgi:hypothetical protein
MFFFSDIGTPHPERLKPRNLSQPAGKDNVLKAGETGPKVDLGNEITSAAAIAAGMPLPQVSSDS